MARRHPVWRTSSSTRGSVPAKSLSTWSRSVAYDIRIRRTENRGGEAAQKEGSAHLLKSHSSAQQRRHLSVGMKATVMLKRIAYKLRRLCPYARYEINYLIITTQNDGFWIEIDTTCTFYLCLRALIGVFSPSHLIPWIRLCLVA